MKRNLKLFVWTEVDCDWTCGIAFALAETAEEAREILRKMLSPHGRTWQEIDAEPEVFENKVGFAIGGGS